MKSRAIIAFAIILSALNLNALELIGPTLRNGSFESIDGIPWDEVQILQDSDFASDGVGYVLINATASGSRGARDGFEQTTPIRYEGGRKLTLSFDARNGEPGMTIVSGFCTIFDSNGQSVSRQRIITNQPRPSKEQWTRYHFTTIISRSWEGTGTVEVFIGLGRGSTSEGQNYYGYIDRVSLVQEHYPRISIEKEGSGVVIDFDGEIYQSDTLSSWEPVSPQPASPWVIDTSESDSSKFYKVIE